MCFAQVDAMADAVPSRRIAVALRDMHRSRLQLIDTRMKTQVRVTDFLRHQPSLPPASTCFVRAAFVKPSLFSSFPLPSSKIVPSLF